MLDGFNALCEVHYWNIPVATSGFRCSLGGIAV